MSQMVPILPPKILILPSNAAEKRRHIAVSHCCALIRHTQCIMCMYFMLSGPLLPTDHQIYFEMENVATTHFFALFARFLHFHENNDLKVPERSKNGPKKVPILSQRPKFCLCSDFSRQVPNPKSYIVAPDHDNDHQQGWESYPGTKVLLPLCFCAICDSLSETVFIKIFVDFPEEKI